GEAEAMAAEILQPRALFNSVTGEVEALVAAGIPTECSHCGQESIGTDALVALVEMVNALKGRVDELSEVVRPYRVERLSERLAAMGLLADSEEPDAQEIDAVTPES